MGLTFYTNPQSRGRIVRWMLEEVGEPYETVVLPYGEKMKDPAFLAVNPMGKVPAIKHGETVVTETSAICAYLADIRPEAGLAPAPDQRGAYYRWLFFAAGPLESAIIAKTMGWEAPPERERMLGYGTYDRVLDVLEQTLAAAPYVAGPDFTAADVCLGAQVVFGVLFNTLAPRPAFQAYVDRLMAREAYQRAMAMDDALAAGMDAA